MKDIFGEIDSLKSFTDSFSEDMGFAIGRKHTKNSPLSFGKSGLFGKRGLGFTLKDENVTVGSSKTRIPVDVSGSHGSGVNIA